MTGRRHDATGAVVGDGRRGSDPRTEETTVPPRGAPRRRLLLFAVVFLVYLSGPNITTTDAYLAVPTAVSLVHSGDLDLDEFRSPMVAGHHGYARVGTRHYDLYPWPVALLAVPGVLAADLLHWLGIGPGSAGLVEANDMGILQLAPAAVVATLAVLVVHRLSLERLHGPARRRLALFVTLTFALATPVWSTASRSLWQHGPSMLLLAVAVLAASRLADGREPRCASVTLGAALAGAYAVRPTNAVPVVLFAGFVAVRHRRQAALFVTGALAVVVPWVAVNLATWGSVLSPYYSARRVSLHDEYLEALAANLLSPARGLLVFAPVVAMAAAGVVVLLRDRSFAALDAVVLASVVLHLLVVSGQNEGWWAGHAFGPRFMADVLPFLAYLALPAVSALHGAVTARARRGPSRAARAAVGTAATAVIVGAAVNAQGAYLRATSCWNSSPVDIDVDPGRVWDWGDPQALSGYRALLRGPIRSAILGPCPPAAETTRSGGGDHHGVAPDRVEAGGGEPVLAGHQGDEGA